MTRVDPYSQLHLLRRLGPLDFRVHSFSVVLPVNSVRPQGIPICKGHLEFRLQPVTNWLCTLRR